MRLNPRDPYGPDPHAAATTMIIGGMVIVALVLALILK